MNNSINFTGAALNKLPVPDSGKKIYRDSGNGGSGLSLYVTPTGHKSFFVRRQVNGKQKRIIIGSFPKVSVDQARAEARRIGCAIGPISLSNSSLSNSGHQKNSNPENGTESSKSSQIPFVGYLVLLNHRMCPSMFGIVAGKDIVTRKETVAKGKSNGEETFGEAFEMFMERHARVNTKTWKEIERIVLTGVSHLFNRPLSSVGKAEMQRLHERIGREHGKYRANRVLGWIRTIYNKKISWGWGGTNPTLGIENFREQKRDRFVLMDELPKLMEALANEQNVDMRDFFLLCLYTGARCGNVLAMEWCDLDFFINEWRIPDTKNGEPMRIPLIDQAFGVLCGREHIRASSRWVFPSKASKSGHLEEPKSAWARVLARAELKNLRIHDLRRTCASYQAMAGTSLPIIGKSLGHKSPQSTAIYARLSNDPVRKSMQSAFDFYAKKILSKTRNLSKI
jgi:integrase